MGASGIETTIQSFLILRIKVLYETKPFRKTIKIVLASPRIHLDVSRWSINNQYKP
jgi:hypothetical protein